MGDAVGHAGENTPRAPHALVAHHDELGAAVEGTLRMAATGWSAMAWASTLSPSADSLTPASMTSTSPRTPSLQSPYSSDSESGVGAATAPAL